MGYGEWKQAMQRQSDATGMVVSVLRVQRSKR